MDDETTAVIVNEAPDPAEAEALAAGEIAHAEAQAAIAETHADATVAVAAIEAEAAVEIAEAQAEAAIAIAEAQSETISPEEFEQCQATLNSVMTELQSIRERLTQPEPVQSPSTPEPESGEATRANPEAAPDPSPEPQKLKRRLKLI